MTENPDADVSIALLTGAGASAKIGIPIMNRMVSQFKDSLPTTGEVSEAYEFLKNLKATSDLEDMLLTIQEIIAFQGSKTHKAVNAFGKKRINSPDPVSAEGLKKVKRQLGAFNRRIRVWIARTCFSFNREIAGQIWGDLSITLDKKGVTVFTTNYDFALEDVALDRGIPIVDNFVSGAHNRMFWDDSLKGLEKDGLKVIKLHGSVNWYSTPQAEGVEKIDVEATQNREGLPLQRVAIFPTRFKDIYESHFFSLYRIFLNVLDRLDLLIIVGHSLRDEYISAAIRDNFRNPNFKVIFIGPSLPKFGGLKDPDGKPRKRVAHLPYKFEDAYQILDYLLNLDEKRDIVSVCNDIVAAKKKDSKIILSPPPRKIEAGKQHLAKVKASFVAIPKVSVSATLLPDSTRNLPSVEIEIEDTVAKQPLEIYGPVNEEFDVGFTIPPKTDLEDRTMVVLANTESGDELASNQYKIHPKPKNKQTATPNGNGNTEEGQTPAEEPTPA